MWGLWLLGSPVPFVRRVLLLSLGETTGELRGVAGEFLQQQLVVALPEGWSLHGAAVMDLGSQPSPVLPTIDHGILE